MAVDLSQKVFIIEEGALEEMESLALTVVIGEALDVIGSKVIQVIAVDIVGFHDYSFGF